MNCGMARVSHSSRPAGVVLVHGLWMPSAAMVPLARRLGHAGHATHLFEFRGRASYDTNLRRLADCLSAQPSPVAVVAHSLGGVLALDALNGDQHLPVSAAVFLGSPVRGSLSGRRLGAWRFGRWLLGGSAPCWAVRTEVLWGRAAPLGIIAGTAALGLGRLLGRLPEENDGVVLESETRVVGAREAISLPVGHSGMLFNRAVADHVIRFLRGGSFFER